jgi:long-chain acyl-CoA synthetase
MINARPFPWEAHYPPGVTWDAPIRLTTLPGMLDDARQRFGNRPAIEFRGGKITFADLARRADRLAAGLRKLGIGQGDAVALLLHNTPFHPIAFFAVLRLGARVVHLSPLDPPRAIASKLKDSGARTLISTNIPGLMQNALAVLAGGAATLLILGDDAEFGAPSPALPIPAEALNLTAISADPTGDWPAISPDDVALLQYTGGTTGVPKAAMLSHANLTAAVSMIDNYGAGHVSIGADDRMIGVLPMFHIYALTGVLLRAVAAGAEILLRPRFDVDATIADLEVGRATVFCGVPTMWIALVNSPGIESRDLSSLRLTLSGGAPLPAEISDKFERLTGQKLGGGWGMTETSPIGALIPEGVTYTPGMIGIPAPGIMMDVVALDDPHKILGPNETGEIRIKGPNVTRGYWNRPEETAAAFADGYLLTGDIGHYDERGFFFLVDRKKDMIISGGFNVYPAMIENAIYEHPDVVEAGVIGIADQYRGQAAKAFVVLRPGAETISLEGLRSFLADRIGRHELPSALEIRDSLPKTGVGKLSRKDLVDEEKARTGQ